MKRHITLILMLLLAAAAQGQRYSFTFRPEGLADTVLYVGRHYRDAVQVVDTARRTPRGTYRFAGNRRWERGIYVLLRQDGRTQMVDFPVDDSRSFTLTGDSVLSFASVRCQGSHAAQRMYTYLARLRQATRQQDSLRAAADEEGKRRLDEEMRAYESVARRQGGGDIFFQLVDRCDTPDVPDTVEDKARYYRVHYWDRLFESPVDVAMLHSPQLFNKMNQFFFGLLYHANADTIALEVDRLMGRIGTDTAMARYVLQFIEPRYYRSTRNIGWDAVWCHIASEYILKGRCPWMRESEVYLARKNYNRISQSIIGAQGQELWMLDTTQIDSPEHWVSSHRQPTRYVILWFWDPDCHHCQEHSAELKVIYDSMVVSGKKRFEVYAVGYDSDVAKWKRYVREHDFRWVNVGGPNVNIDYQEAYNVHGAPTMIILDEHRRIIMNKVLPIKSLMAFLDSHERGLNKQ